MQQQKGDSGLHEAFSARPALRKDAYVLVIGIWLTAAAAPKPDRHLPFVAVAVALAMTPNTSDTEGFQPSQSPIRTLHPDEIRPAAD